MREILFKAKRRDNNEWIQGFYHSDPEDGCFISWFESKMNLGNMDEPPSQDIFKVSLQVIPETICQFINRLDKHGNKIFHNDRMKGVFYNKGTSNGKKKELEFTVGFEPYIGFFVDCVNYGEFRFFPHLEDCEVTGNIHD